MTENGKTKYLNDEEVRSILRRATEIEASRRGMITPDLLKEIAHEAGISAEAINVALEESRPVAPATDLAGANRLWVSVQVLTASTLLGAAARLLRPLFDRGIHWESLGGVIAICAYLGIAAWDERGVRRQSTFQIRNLASWIGFTAGWSLIHGSVWDDVVGVSAAFAIGCGLIGSMIVALRSGANHPNQPVAEDAPRPGLLQRLVKKVVGKSGAKAPIQFHDLAVGLKKHTALGVEAPV